MGRWGDATYDGITESAQMEVSIWKCHQGHDIYCGVAQSTGEKMMAKRSIYCEQLVFPKQGMHVMEYIVECESVNAKSGREGGIVMDTVNILVVK